MTEDNSQDDIQADNSTVGRTRTEIVVEFVQTRFWSIVVLILGLIGVSVYLFTDFETPRWAKIAFFTFLFLSPFGYVVARYVVNLLWDPGYIWVVDVDAREIDGALFRFPSDAYQALEVTDGELDRVTPSLVFAKNVDIEAMTAEGNWRGTMSDRELLRNLEKIEECRTQLEDDAKRGFAIETKAFSIIRNATRKATLSVVETFEKGTLPDDGKAIGTEIEKAIEQFDLDDQVRHTSPDSDDDLDDQDDGLDDLPDDHDDDPLAQPEETTDE